MNRVFDFVGDVLVWVIFRFFVLLADVFNKLSAGCLSAASFILGSDE